MNRLAFLWISVLVLGVGCETKPIVPATTNTSDGELKKLRSQLDRLKADNALLTSQVEEIQARERKLADALSDQRFINQQQTEQIKVLAEAPVQRDLYQRRAESLALQVYRLERELERVTGGTVVTPPAGTPASQPAASHPAGREAATQPAAWIPARRPATAPATRPTPPAATQPATTTTQPATSAGPAPTKQ